MDTSVMLLAPSPLPALVLVCIYVTYLLLVLITHLTANDTPDG